MSFLVDTNVVSELRKGERCDPGVASWFSRLSADEIYLSVLTIGEIRKGIELIRRRDPKAAESLETWLAELKAAHSARILPLDPEAAEEWGRLNVPDPLPMIDSLLAATAKVEGLTVVTRNVKDVTRTGVACLNPFTATGDEGHRRDATVGD
ncbi:MAG: type II toxin-antitoxin system VapC family toxin [bacterium]|nr:type II toxin-antitoxin system VapC family toxin [bacterium]